MGGLVSKTSDRTPQEQIKDWNSTIRKERSKLDRKIRAIQGEEEKLKRSVKEAAKKGHEDVCRILAKQVVNARKPIVKIRTSQAHLSAVQNQIKNQLAIVRMGGSLERSTEVLKAMQSLVNVPEIAATMRNVSNEMTKAGIIDEMINDLLEGAEEDSEEMEEAAKEEVNKVLWELTAGQLGQAPEAVTDSLPTHGAVVTEEKTGPEEALGDIRTRLEALTS